MTTASTMSAHRVKNGQNPKSKMSLMRCIRVKQREERRALSAIALLPSSSEWMDDASMWMICVYGCDHPLVIGWFFLTLSISECQSENFALEDESPVVGNHSPKARTANHFVLF